MNPSPLGTNTNTGTGSRSKTPTQTPSAALPDALRDFETPVAVLDVERVRANARRVVEYCAGHGLRWRPHVKTHKSLRVARIQLEAGAAGLTVATPREAEIMAEVTTDLLLAYPPVGEARLRRLMALPAAVSLTVALDSERALDDLAASAAEAGRRVGVLVEVDLGMHRVGVQGPDEAVALARRVRAAESLDFRGILFYPGHIRLPAEEQDADLAAAASRLDAIREALERADLEPPVVSGGSTPTIWRSHDFPGITEVRSGTCIFNDRDMVSLGVCEEDACAYTILATVVSTAVPGQAVIDAGSKALAKEELRSAGAGYGALLGHPELHVAALSEEHGIIRLAGSDWKPRVGDRVRVVPNHVCVSVNLQDRILAYENGAAEAWPVEARGRF
jgi:D-serine deaminase-like pyridoxal phosphate-dependent protein